MTFDNFISLTSLWVLYFLIHSVLANNSTKAAFKKRFRHLAHSYRLLYNLLATAFLLPMAYYIYLLPSDSVITWDGGFSLLATGIALFALSGFVYSLKFYGGMDFLGITQYKNNMQDEVSDFVISPLHRFVRHPWYLFALMIIWTRDMNAHFLLSSIMMTGYFFIGSYFEDKKLQQTFGQRFKEYSEKVPGIIPNPKKFLTKEEALALVKKNNSAGTDSL